MKKVFISQPMNGRTNEEIKVERERAKKELERLFYPEESVTILESWINGVQLAPGINKDLWMLSKSIEILAQADAVYFAPGWDKARGCRIEHECARQYGIACLTDL